MPTTILNSIGIKNIRLLLSVFVSCYLVSGCSLTELFMAEQEQNELNRYLEQYTKLEPEIQRVLALESDMQTIIDELSKYSELTSDPLAGNSSLGNIQRPASWDNANQTQDTQEQQEGAYDSNGGYAGNRLGGNATQSRSCRTNDGVYSSHCSSEIGIHLAAFYDSQGVQAGWHYLKPLLPASLQTKLPVTSTIKSQNNTYHSLRLGPFTSVRKAEQACNGILKHIRNCTVTEYKGRRVI